MDAVPFAARQLADLFLLLRAAEIEPGDIGARVHALAAEFDFIHAAGDFFENRVVVVQGVAVLVDVGEDDGGAKHHLAGVGFFLAHDHPEHCCLARAVRADNADNRPFRHVEGAVGNQFRPAVALRHVGEFQHLVAKARPGRDLDKDVALVQFERLFHQGVVAFDTRLALFEPAGRRRANPLALALEKALAIRFLFLGAPEPFRLLVEPGRVIPLVGDAASVLEFENPLGDVVEEIAVVGDDNDRARVLPQLVLEPGYRLSVEVVGRFVEKEQVGFFQERLAESNAAALAARKGRNVGVVRRQHQRVGGDVELAVDLPCVLGVNFFLQAAHLVHRLIHLVGRQILAKLGRDLFVTGDEILQVLDRFLEVFPHVFGRVEARLLRHVDNLHALDQLRLAGKVLVLARHDAEQGRLARAVLAHDADLGAEVERQADVFQNRLAAVSLRDVLHGKNKRWHQKTPDDSFIQLA